MWKGNSHQSRPIMPFRCNCKPSRIAPPSSSPRARAHTQMHMNKKLKHTHPRAHTPAGERKGRISQLALWTERREGEGEPAATSMHISHTIKLELAFDASLTNCLLNKRLGLQHNGEGFGRQRETSGGSTRVCVHTLYAHVRTAGPHVALICTNTPFMSPFSSMGACNHFKIRCEDINCGRKNGVGEVKEQNAVNTAPFPTGPTHPPTLMWPREKSTLVKSKSTVC